MASGQNLKWRHAFAGMALVAAVAGAMCLPFLAQAEPLPIKYCEDEQEETDELPWGAEGGVLVPELPIQNDRPPEPAPCIEPINGGGTRKAKKEGEDLEP